MMETMLFPSVPECDPRLAADRIEDNAALVNYVDAMSGDDLWDAVSMDDASQGEGLPVSSGPFRGYRMVLPVRRGDGRLDVAILLVETAPVQGRVWTRALDGGSVSWGPWRTVATA